MPKVLAYINECLQCPHRHYATSGQYECGMRSDAGFLPNFGREKPPEWCPLPNAPLSQSPEVGKEAAWLIPSIVNFNNGRRQIASAEAQAALQGAVAWGASMVCDTQDQARVDKDGTSHFPQPLYTASQLSAAVAQEKERCAKVCEDMEKFFVERDANEPPELCADASTGCVYCFDAIRSNAGRV